MMKRVAVAVACLAGTAATGMVANPANAASTTHVVRPGQSIQAAVDAARAGDTVLVMPGTYQGSVRVTRPDVTVRGANADRTVLTPAARPASEACAAQTGVGICVSGADRVRIESLTVSGFAKYGVFASDTDRLTVTHVRATANAQYGIGEERSTRSHVVSNRATGNGQAGLLVANTVSEEGGATDTMGTIVAGNALDNNHQGLVLRRVRDVTVESNHATGNCAGMMLVGDENTPHAGDLRVHDNTVTMNNATCAATDRLPVVQGAGIVMTGIENSTVTRNTVMGNVGTSTMSGGIVLFPSLVGTPNRDNTVQANTLSGNGPADLADHDTAGVNNTFSGNSCQVSMPAGRC